MIRKILIYILIIAFPLANIYSQRCDYTYIETEKSDNTKPRRQIRKIQRYISKDSVSIVLMEGFYDSVDVYISGELHFTGRGVEKGSTSFSGIAFMVAKKDLFGQYVEVYAHESMKRTIFSVSENSAERTIASIGLRYFKTLNHIRVELVNYIYRFY